MTKIKLNLNIERKISAIEESEQLAGWRLYVTNAPITRLSLNQAIVYYRDQWIVERGFHRFKRGQLPALPIYFQNQDRSEGLMFLLTLALRVFTLIEFVVREAISASKQKLAGLYDGNPNRATERPSAEQLLDLLQKSDREIYNRSKLNRAIVSYKQVKNLKPTEFKRLCGVTLEIFLEMVKVIAAEKVLAKKSGRPSKLSFEDQLLMTLEYWREYRTYFHMGTNWGLDETSVLRIVRKVENILIKSGLFNLGGKKQLYVQDSGLEILVVDVAEHEVERPKKNRRDITVASRSVIQSNRKY